MDLKTKFNISVTDKGIIVDYLATDLTTVTSKVNIPTSDIHPYHADYKNYGLSPYALASDNTTWGVFFFDNKWEQPQFRWILPYANIHQYSTDGSSFGTVPAFADIETAINAAVALQSEH